MDNSTVKLTIAISNPELDEEELDTLTQKFMKELRQLDNIECVDRVVSEKPTEGARPLASFLLGVLQAEFNWQNIQSVWDFMAKRFPSKGAIEVSFEKDGRKFSGKANSVEKLKELIEAAKSF